MKELRGDWYRLGMLGMVAVLVRIGFILIFPSSVSTDVHNWEDVRVALQQHQNPYAVTDHLNWPPLWLQLIYLASEVSKTGLLTFVNSIRAILIVSELLLICVLYKHLKTEIGPYSATRAVLFGIDLNPICILLVVQHCNFDVIAGLWILLGTTSMLRFQRAHDRVDWFLACLFVGLGILTKTVPLVLLPLLLPGARGYLKSRDWLLGTTLALGPVLLGISIIFVLSPNHVWQNVIEYRSAPGWFGITGILGLAGLRELWPIYSNAFTICAGLTLLLTGTAFFRTGFVCHKMMIITASIALISVPVFGPGYAPQYAYWFISLLILCFTVVDGRSLKTAIIVLWAVGVLTYCIEYGFLPTFGRALGRLITSPAVERLGRILEHPEQETVVRLPLFASYLWLLRVLIVDLTRVSSSNS